MKSRKEVCEAYRKSRIFCFNFGLTTNLLNWQHHLLITHVDMHANTKNDKNMNFSAQSLAQSAQGDADLWRHAEISSGWTVYLIHGQAAKS